jgi:hypothetical protein
VAGSCEFVNEPSGPIKGKEFIDHLNNHQLLKKSSGSIELFSDYLT